MHRAGWLLLVAGCSGRALETPGAPPDLALPPPSLDCPHGAGLQAGAPWPMTGRCPDHAGRARVNGPRSPRVKWSFPTGDFIDSSPSVDASGLVYAGSGDGTLYAVDGQSGQLRFQRPLDAPVGTTAISAAGALFVGEYTSGRTSYVYSLTADLGTVRWRWPVFDSFGPTIDERGWVYITEAEQILAFKADNGDQKGRFAIHGGITLDPLLTGDGAIIGASTTALVAIDLATSALRWSLPTGTHPIYTSPAAGPDGTIYASSADGVLYAVDGRSGALRWTFHAPERVTATVAVDADGTVYLPSGNRVFKLHSTGRMLVSLETASVARSVIVDAGNAVYVGCDDGALYLFDGVSNAPRRTVHVGGPLVGRPAMGADGTLYVGSIDHHLYAVGD